MKTSSVSSVRFFLFAAASALALSGAAGCAAADPDVPDADEVGTSDDAIVAGRTFVVEGEMIERAFPKVDFTDPSTFQNDAWKTPVITRTGKQARVVARVLSVDDAGYDVDVTVRVEGEGSRRQRTRLDINFGGYGAPVWGGSAHSGSQLYTLELQAFASGNSKVWSLHRFELLRDLPEGPNDRSKELVFEPTTRLPLAAR